MLAEEWDKALAAVRYPAAAIKRLVSAIREGVEIGYLGDRSVGRTAVNAKSTTDPRVAKLISAAIDVDVAAGYKRGPFDSPPFPAFWVSPLGAVPKGPDGIRLIHNLSHPFGGESVNAGIEREEYIMQRFEDAVAGVRRLGRCALMTKFDVKAAFKLVPVRPSDYPLLGLKWEGKYYYEVVLPFGLRTSGYRWDEFAKALHLLTEVHLGVTYVYHYVDDFLLLAPPNQLERAARERDAFQRLCERLGVPIADEKTVGPSTEVVFLGITIDTQLMECRLTDKRRDQLRALLQGWAIGGQHMSYEDLMSLVGKLDFACVVIRPGVTFMRRLRGIMMKMKAARLAGAPAGDSCRLDINTLLDVRWWLDVFLTPAGNRRPIVDDPWITAEKFELFTDACNLGYGAVFGNKWIQGKWSPEQLAFARVNVRISIPYLELHALVHAAVVWGPRWRGKQIVFRCDAQAAVAAVDNMRSRNDGMSDLLRVLYAAAARHQFQFKCVHVAGEKNVIADALSRDCSVQDLLHLLPTAEVTPSTSAPLTGAHLPVVPWELTATEVLQHAPLKVIYAQPYQREPAAVMRAPSPISVSGEPATTISPTAESPPTSS